MNSDSEILKYELWIEQNEQCPYTGKTIGIAEFLGGNPAYDIEHTFPQSRFPDNSRSNKTLTCSKFNRDVKKAKIPSELANYEDILANIESFGWQKEVDKLGRKIFKLKGGGGDKAAKDKRIVERNKLKMEREYWKEKLFTFRALEIPEKFTNAHLNDTRSICKYAKQYMATAFEKVFAYKASALKTFYNAWGIEAKSRDHHLHHCVDAIIAACVTKQDYEAIAKYYHDCEERPTLKSKRPQPWVGFDKFVNDTIKDEVIVSHFKKNNLLKKAKKIVRKRGVIQKTKDNKPMFAQGDSARAPLHQETFYGKIIDPEKGETRCVVRKAISSMSKSDKEKIVDPVIRKIVLNHKDDKTPIWSFIRYH
jgi:CRISPR-associated endonuclease Csn1